MLGLMKRLVYRSVKNFLKSIASGVIANVVSIVPGLAIAVGAGSIFKLFPGIGTGGGIVIGIMANVALMYVAGMILPPLPEESC